MRQGKDRGRGWGERYQGIDGEKSDGPKDDSVKLNHCGDVRHNAVRCPGQLCGILYRQRACC